MADKRMFSKTIIDSDAFLDMPLSTQALYFHLSMRADDEGFINNPKKICRMIGSGQDELKILIGKRFLLTFESGVVVIKHWLIHNTIRQDRVKETVHAEEKSKLVLKDNNIYTEKLETVDIPLCGEPATICQPNDGQMSAQIRLDKIRLDKIRLDKISIDNTMSVEEEKPAAVTVQKKYASHKMVIDYYKYICCQFPQPRTMTDKRVGHIKARIEEYGIGVVFEALEIINESSFLNDNKVSTWLNFDWIWNVNNFAKVIEGNYNKKVENVIKHESRPKNAFHNFSTRDKEYTNEELERKLGIRK